MPKKAETHPIWPNRQQKKLLLALLVSEDVQVDTKDSHRLDVLVDKLPQENALRERLADVSSLTIYATTYRYTKSAGRLPQGPDWNQLAQKITQVKTLIQEASVHHEVDLDASDRNPAGNVDPIRNYELPPP